MQFLHFSLSKHGLVSEEDRMLKKDKKTWYKFRKVQLILGGILFLLFMISMFTFHFISFLLFFVFSLVEFIVTILCWKVEPNWYEEIRNESKLKDVK